MLGKLFKHDMRALSRVLLPLHAVVLAVALVGSVSAFAAYSADEREYSSFEYAKTYESSLGHAGAVSEPGPRDSRAYGDDLGVDYGVDYGDGYGYGDGDGYGYGDEYGDGRSSELAFEEALCDMVFAYGALGVLLCCLALAAAPLASLVVIVHRFYRNLFCDEGYLTLTLPAKPGQQLASKALSGSLWLAASFCAALVGSLAISLAAVGFADVKPSDLLPYWLLSTMGGAGYATADGSYAVAGAASMAIGCLEALMICYAAFAAGCGLAARHKVAASLGLVAAFWLLTSLVKGFAGFAGRSAGVFLGMGVLTADNAGFFASLGSALALGAGWAASAAAIAACWAVCLSRIRRPNLP